MNRDQSSADQPPENNFETIYQRRINELEDKVNKYCSQYDALMNLLPIGGHFSSVLEFQKEAENMDRTIDIFEQQISSINNEQVQIDTKGWLHRIEQINKSICVNSEQLQMIRKKQQAQEVLDEDDFEQQMIQKIQNYEQQLINKLAEYKNWIDFERHKYQKNNYQALQKQLKAKIQSFYGPFNAQIDDLLQQIEICRLKVPLRELTKFHDFNYNRLIDQIVSVNHCLQGLCELMNLEDKSKQKDNLNVMKKLQMEIDSIRYQAIGNKQKCLNDSLLYRPEHSNSELQNDRIQKHITDCFDQLQQTLEELTNKLHLLKKYADFF